MGVSVVKPDHVLKKLIFDLLTPSPRVFFVFYDN